MRLHPGFPSVEPISCISLLFACKAQIQMPDEILIETSTLLDEDDEHKAIPSHGGSK
jgi:hypothetical protein